MGLIGAGRYPQVVMAKTDNRHAESAESQPLTDPVVSGPSEADPGGNVVVLDTGASLEGAAEDSVVLGLGDLLPDASGEVVLFAEKDVPVNILSDEPLTRMGIAEAHVTASGLDVTGLHYYSFESGITLYSANDLLIIDDPGAV